MVLCPSNSLKKYRYFISLSLNANIENCDHEAKYSELINGKILVV